MKGKKLFLVFLFSLLTALPAQAFSRDEALEHFVRAGFDYKEGRYQEAIALYEKILKEGWESGPLYFNLANSYFKQGDLGHAILNYEKARRLLPRDSDVRANRRYALSLVKGGEEDQGASWWPRVDAWVAGSLTPNETTVVLFVIFVLAGSGVLGLMYSPAMRKIGRPVLIVLGISFLVLGAGFIGQILGQRNDAVVLEQTEARFEPRGAATAYFELYEGNIVREITREGAWIKIQRPDGKKGWVPQQTVAFL